MFFVIGTPIGNLQDITLRALETLKTLDILVTENVATTKKLLSHFQINIPKLMHIRQQKEIQLAILNQGLKIGLVVEAGTSAISDPGTNYVEFAVKSHVKIEVIPGVSALTAAVSICPFKFDDFIFVGFLPKKSGKLKQLLTLNSETNVAAFESPFRIKKTLGIICEMFPDKELFIARELTKTFESHYYGRASEISSKIVEKGEITMLIRKSLPLKKITKLRNPS